MWVSRKRPQRLHREDHSLCACCPPPPTEAEAETAAAAAGATPMAGAGSSSGCLEGACLNRVSYVHCDPRSCPCGELCSNRPFHLLRSPLLQTFLTENR